jgi:hypothetical protein
MNEFDDRHLRDALRRRAGAVTDGLGLEAARAKVVARAVRVRRQRAAVAGGAAMAGVIAVAVFVVGPGTDSVITSPADQTDASRPGPVDSTVGTTDSAPTVPDQTGPDQGVIDTTPAADTSPSPVTTVPAVNPPAATSTTAPAATAPPAPGTTVIAPPTTPAPTPPTTPAPTTSVPGTAPDTQTYSSAGGSITVEWDGIALDLQTTTPAAGFEAEVEDDLPDRIRVRFRGPGGDVRIELRVEDGQVVRVE